MKFGKDQVYISTSEVNKGKRFLVLEHNGQRVTDFGKKSI